MCLYIYLRSVYARNSPCYGANVWFIFSRHPFYLAVALLLSFPFFFSFFTDYFIVYLQFVSNFSCLSWSQVSRGCSVRRIFIASRTFCDAPVLFFFLPSSYFIYSFYFSCCYSLEGTWDILSNDCLIQTLSPPFTVLRSLILSLGPSLLSRRPATTAGNFYWKRISRQLSRPSTIWITRSLAPN